MSEANELYVKLLEPIEKKMIRTVGRIMRDPDDAADVFQEVLLVIWVKLAHIVQHPNPHAYIMRICITRSYDALRKKARRQRREMYIENLKTTFWPFRYNRPSYIRDSGSAVRQAISMLPPHQSQAVMLRSMEGNSYDMIAKILGCSEATARSHFSKGKHRLAKILTELGILKG